MSAIIISSHTLYDTDAKWQDSREFEFNCNVYFEVKACEVKLNYRPKFGKRKTKSLLDQHK